MSNLVAAEDNPMAASLEGFVLHDARGRRTRPWRAMRRAERRARGVETQRPLLVFLETPATRQDFDSPWLGAVRFDRPGFPTTKEAITRQVFGDDFNFRDPASMAGFFFRESGGKLMIRGDASSVHTVTVPFIPFDGRSIAAAIIEQLDPVVDFTTRADGQGWVHPILVMTPYSFALDIYDEELMQGLSYWGYGPPVYDSTQALTGDRYPDGTHAALSTLAITVTGMGFGANTTPDSPAFGLGDDAVRSDSVQIYAHEYGHAIGLSHMFTGDFALRNDFGGPGADGASRFSNQALSRTNGSGFATSIMNYSVDRYGATASNDPRWSAGLDPVNRAKLGWGHVTEVTVSDERTMRELTSEAGTRIQLVEHLGRGPTDLRAQILKINLPPKTVALFPTTNAADEASGYWRPGHTGRRMVWSGRSHGGSRLMEASLRVPAGLRQPVLSFWTKYGAHSGWLYPAGLQLGWVQISTDRGRTWTSLAGSTSSTVVDPWRQTLQWFGDDLGAPAFTGDSRQYSDTGWVREQVPLPVPPGSTVRVRFNFSGWEFGTSEPPSSDIGWWIDDVYLGTASNPQQHLVSDFEGEDAGQWQGLNRDFDRGFGFSVVEETSPFPQTYFFELRGQNPHDEMTFQESRVRELNGTAAFAEYRYNSGVVGYFADHFATFWALPSLSAGSANERRPARRRLHGIDYRYPHRPEASRLRLYDFVDLLGRAQDPASGITLDDVVFILTLPTEQIFPVFDWGVSLVVFGDFPNPPPVSILDATPTYRPLDVFPAQASTPFPSRPPARWPYVIGAAGGWPKSVRHGVLGENDPTTTVMLGQPFLARDAAFHPDRNPIFSDAADYQGAFYTEFARWHEQKTQAAFATPTEWERVTVTTRPVTATIDEVTRQYCFMSANGVCGPRASAVTRPWVEQLVYERLQPIVAAAVVGSCPFRPIDQSPAARPLWDAYNTCVAGAIETTHQFTTQLVERARHLGDNPNYAVLNAWGDQGTLNPRLWTDSYLYYWSVAKAPAALPAFGVSVEVEHITRGATPTATLRLRRSGEAGRHSGVTSTPQ